MMIGRGTSREKFEPRSYLRKKTMRRGPARGNRENVVIDVDSDNLDDVIIIDVTESLQNKLRGSNVLRKNRKYPFPGVISIDDDDINHIGDGATAECSRENNDNSGGSKSHTSDCFINSMCLDADECYVIYEKKSAFKFSKCGQASSAKESSRKSYGLGPNSESDSSENEFSDCELMEGSFEVLREQWEKASVKKKKRQLFNDQSAFDGKAGASGSHSHVNLNVGCDGKGESSVGPETSGFSHWHYQEKRPFSHSPTGDCHRDNPAYDVGKSSEESTQNVTGSGKQKFCVDKDGNYQHADEILREDFPTSSRQKNHDHADTISSCSKSKPEMFYYVKVNKENGTVKSQNYKFTLRPESYKFSHVLSGDNVFGEGPLNDGSAVSSSLPTCALKSCCGADLASCDGPLCSNTLSSGKQVDENSYSHLKLNLNSEDISLPEKSVRDGLCTNDGGASSSGQGDIIFEREKLKESDEFKRAMEEEWASRHKQLLLQQEEAQRLRKRKKAESMRLLDMERRQKQRVEEVRETQKKDEENINLKEQFRAEIRKEISKLELISINMVLLLRGLGIQVGGGVNPTSNEVHAAYKRALLKFHPDRASKTDMRQQVEAEEKFKLISRMKEKFLPTSCY